MRPAAVIPMHTPEEAVAELDHAQARRRVDDREIEAELAQTLVEETREHAGRAVARILFRPRPERLLAHAPVPPLGDGHAERFAHAAPDRKEPLSGRVTTDLADLFAE